MARGLLVSFAGYPVMPSSFFPDNGLASLAGALLARGHEVKILDFNTVSMLRRLLPRERSASLAAQFPKAPGLPDEAARERLLAISAELEADISRAAEWLADEIGRHVEKQQSQFVGFKLWSGDGFVVSVQLAEQLRRRFPKLKLYAGGPAVFAAEHAVFSFTEAFDALVDGEGERAIVGLAGHAEGRQDLRDVPNLIVRHEGVVRRTPRAGIPDLDELPLPAYGREVYEGLTADEHLLFVVADESRGCSHGCAFCLHPEVSGRKVRRKSARRLIEELEAWSASFGSSVFRFGGSATPPRVLDEFSAAAMEQGRGFAFCGFAHPGDVTPMRAEALARAGCKSLFLGVESFDDRDLIRHGKRLTAEQSRAAVRACLEFGIAPVISLIMPLPGQGDEAFDLNVREASSLCAGTRASVQTQFPVLLPRTEWWHDRPGYGFELSIGEDDYRRFAAVYRVRHFVPPVLWKPLPYRLDGMGFGEFARTNGAFQRCLAQQGVVVNVPDEVALLADRLGKPILEFRQMLQGLFFSLDPDAVRQFVDIVNSRLRSA
jgi:radical SAM superfamily enzyme YgiQ (UPF0313 family)